MASPTPVAFNGASNTHILRGRSQPQPTWLANKVLNKFIEIPNTTGAAGAPIDEFSGGCMVGTQFYAPLCGGHSATDNRVVSIELNTNNPAWVLRNPPSDVSDMRPDLPYYLDGKPISRHVRHNAQYFPALGRILMLTARDVYGNGPPSLPNVDGFNLATNQWDIEGSWQSLPGVGSAGGIDGGACLDPQGNGWTYSCSRKFDVGTKTWSSPLTVTAPKRVRYPWATGPNYMFGLCLGDGWGYDVGLGICAIRQIGNVQEQITFNASPAVNQFIADVPAEAGMDYDSANNCFLFYDGYTAGRLYKIIPNASTVWDMELFTVAIGSDNPPIVGARIQSRFKYISALKGFVILPRKDSNIWFLPTSL